MRILTFLHSFEPGGVERVALRLNRQWQADGVDTVVVMGRSTGAMADEATGVRYRVLATRGRLTAWWETTWMILALPRFIRRTRPDVLFCAGNTYAVVAVAMKIILGRRCPPIVAKISNDLSRQDMVGPVRWGYHLWCRIQARFIDRFVGMATATHAEIAAAMRVGPDRIDIILDPAISQSQLVHDHVASVPRAGRHYIGAGRLSGQKNFALLIEAFASIAGPEDKLTIVGEGPERAALERLARRRGVADRVMLPGFVASIFPWLATGDVFVLSSDYEGVPAVIVEALAAGIAIVATDCSVSMRDMLDGGALGTLVKPGDRDGLAQAMAAAALAPDTAGAQCRKASRFTVEQAADRYLALFRAVAA